MLTEEEQIQLKELFHKLLFCDKEDFDILYYDYDAYRKELAEEVSIEIGEEKARKEIAKKMLNDNEPIEKIIKYTKFTQEEIEELK